MGQSPRSPGQVGAVLRPEVCHGFARGFGSCTDQRRAVRNRRRPCSRRVRRLLGIEAVYAPQGLSRQRFQQLRTFMGSFAGSPGGVSRLHWHEAAHLPSRPEASASASLLSLSPSPACCGLCCGINLRALELVASRTILPSCRAPGRATTPAVQTLTLTEA